MVGAVSFVVTGVHVRKSDSGMSLNRGSLVLKIFSNYELFQEFKKQMIYLT